MPVISFGISFLYRSTTHTHTHTHTHTDIPAHFLLFIIEYRFLHVSIHALYLDISNIIC